MSDQAVREHAATLLAGRGAHVGKRRAQLAGKR